MRDRDPLNSSWPSDFFSPQRAYRVNVAIRQLHRQLRSLLAAAGHTDICERIHFDATVMDEEVKNGSKFALPAQNYTCVWPSDCSDDGSPRFSAITKATFKKLRPELISRLLVWDRQMTFDDHFPSGFKDKAIRELRVYDKDNNSSFRNCFDLCVDLVTRLPAINPIHDAICEHYFDQRRGKEEGKSGDDIFLYDVRMPQFTLKERRKSPFPADIKAWVWKDPAVIPESYSSTYFSLRADRLNDHFFLTPLRSFVANESRIPEVKSNRYIASIPIHTSHTWEKAALGTFLGWLHVFFHRPPGDSQDLFDNAPAEYQAQREKVLKTLWPLLDPFAIDFLESEIDEYLLKYRASLDGTAWEAFRKAVPRISGWKIDDTPPACPDQFDHFTLIPGRPWRLYIDVKTEGGTKRLCLQPKSTTFLGDGNRYLIGRLVSGLLRAYARLEATYAQSVSPQLEKYRQMLQLLDEPLRGLSEALAEVQGQTQEIRAILHEPAKALFASYRLLSDLFTEHSTLMASKHVAIRVSHGANYGKEDARVVLAVALCRILGKADQLQELTSPERIVALAREIVAECERKEVSSYAGLLEALRWLFEQEDNSLANIFFDDGVSEHVTKLKEVLFKPFKLSTDKWSTKALALAVRDYVDDKALARERCLRLKERFLSIEPNHTPCSFHSLLAFLTGFCAAISEATAVKAIDLKSDPSSRTEIRLTFHKKWLLREDVSTLAALLSDHIFAETRDWRIRATNAGNFRKPFIDLASHLLGVGAPRQEEGRPVRLSDPKWHPVPSKALEPTQWFMVKSLERDRAFSVRAVPTESGNDKLIAADLVIEWDRFSALSSGRV